MTKKKRKNPRPHPQLNPTKTPNFLDPILLSPTAFPSTYPFVVLEKSLSEIARLTCAGTKLPGIFQGAEKVTEKNDGKSLMNEGTDRTIIGKTIL